MCARTLLELMSSLGALGHAAQQVWGTVDASVCREAVIIPSLAHSAKSFISRLKVSILKVSLKSRYASKFLRKFLDIWAQKNDIVTFYPS